MKILKTFSDKFELFNKNAKNEYDAEEQVVDMGLRGLKPIVK